MIIYLPWKPVCCTKHIKVLTSETDFRGHNEFRTWEKAKEEMEMDIIHKYDGGQLKNVIVDYKTNVKMTRHDAWEHVM